MSRAGARPAQTGPSRASSIGRKGSKCLGPGDGDDRDIARRGARAPARGAGRFSAPTASTRRGSGEFAARSIRRRPQLCAWRQEDRGHPPGHGRAAPLAGGRFRGHGGPAPATFRLARPCRCAEARPHLPLGAQGQVDWRRPVLVRSCGTHAAPAVTRAASLRRAGLTGR